MSSLGLLVALIVVFLVIWAVQYLSAAFAIPPQIRAVVTVLVVAIAVLWLLGNVGVLNVPLRVR